MLRMSVSLERGSAGGKGAKSPALTLIADNLDQDPPTLRFQSTVFGGGVTLTFDFDTSGTTDPGKGNADLGSWTVGLVSQEYAGDMTELLAFEGTGYVWVRVTKGGADSAPILSQQVTVAAPPTPPPTASDGFVDPDGTALSDPDGSLLT